MAGLLDHLLARIGELHARRVYARFMRAVRQVDQSQQQALARALAQVRNSDFGRAHKLAAVRHPADLRRALPLQNYEHLRPVIDRVRDGATDALFSPGVPLHMFAMSSGTTALSKYVPVTGAFVEDYRRGWNTFGVKMLLDHPRAILRHILQSSGRHDESRTSAGIPCGAITGLLARTQKGIVRRFYVGTPDIAAIADSRARQYTLMRCGVVRDVSFAVTANPATLLQLARLADAESERLIRDVRDGSLDREFVPDAQLRARIARRLRPDPARARALEQLRGAHGALRPRDYWRLEFLACWTGGSMGHYLPSLPAWYGDLPIRDVGLLASEGRVTIPLEDNTPAGVLDVTAGVFEFIPLEAADSPDPPTLGPRELETGRHYVVVLTNTAGLVRYRLDDVVCVRGYLEQAPMLEFLHRAGRVSSLAGEKLTENQVVAAVATAAARLGLAGAEFVLAPVWSDPPYYRLYATHAPSALGPAVDDELARQNSEYATRRSGKRLAAIELTPITPAALHSFDRKLLSKQGATAEQFKRPCLLTRPGEDSSLSGPAET